MASAKVWFITGISGGFGRCLADEVIKKGDFVIGTLRKPEQVAEFNKEFEGKGMALRMDVNHPEEVKKAVAEALQKHKRIDVLVNNAGYGLFGAVEEVSDEEARDQLETNFFGVLRVTQEILPAMRRQGEGHILQISSMGGILGVPGLGIYNATKFALEGLSEALALEVKPLGIHVTLVEPGPFRTEWAGGSARTAKRSIKEYESTAHARIKQIHGYSGNQPGDPVKAAQAIIRAVASEKPPLHLPLGKVAIDAIRNKLAALEKDIAEWEDVSVKTAFAA